MEQLAREEGLIDDLLDVFGGNIFKTHSIISLAFFPYLSGRAFDRFAKWQDIHQTLLNSSLTAPDIIKLLKCITEKDLIELNKLCLHRLVDAGSSDRGVLDRNSASGSALGKCQAVIHWGNEKEEDEDDNEEEYKDTKNHGGGDVRVVDSDVCVADGDIDSDVCIADGDIDSDVCVADGDIDSDVCVADGDMEYKN